jgi:hypothetical protein
MGRSEPGSHRGWGVESMERLHRATGNGLDSDQNGAASYATGFLRGELRPLMIVLVQN